MRDTRTDWLFVGIGLLLVSFFAAFMATSGSESQSRDALVIESWVERTGFWLGLIFVAGYLLDGIHRGRGR